MLTHIWVVKVTHIMSFGSNLFMKPSQGHDCKWDDIKYL